MAGQSALEAWLTWAFSPALSAIVVTLLITLLTPVILHFYFFRKSAAKELPSFLLLGPSGSGKTSLLTLLANGAPSPTQTSQEPQIALCQTPPTTRTSADRYRSENDTSARDQPQILVIDTPGHGKLRHHAVSSLTTGASLKGLLFVVDSASVSSAAGLAEAAEYLHDILLLLQQRHTQAKTSRDPPSLPVLVAANKQDVFTSLPAGLVKASLEKEIARIRTTRSKGILDSGIGMEDETGSDEERNWLGEFGSREFSFAQMAEHGVDVSVEGGTVRGEDGKSGSVDAWWAWMGENL